MFPKSLVWRFGVWGVGESQPSPLAKRHHEVGTQAGGQDPAKEAERGRVMAPRAALLGTDIGSVCGTLKKWNHVPWREV